jgi:hypothetical protein
MLAAITTQSVAMARWAFYAALLLWVVKWIVGRDIFRPQPLIKPLLVFLVLLGVATCLSYAPLLSWLRMGWFTVLLLAVMVAQSISSMRQVKLVVALLLLGGAVSAAMTGWQYAYGIGTELPVVERGTPLFLDGLRSGDLIQTMTHHRTRSLGEWQRALEVTSHDQQLRLHVGRSTPIVYRDFIIPRSDLETWLQTPGMQVKRGRPLRAQGRQYHYVPYAGELLLLGALAFGMAVASGGRRSIRGVLFVLFTVLFAALLATLTRTFLAALLVSCGATFWLSHKRIRLVALIGLMVAVAVATVWIRKERGYGWLAPKDAGTEYREQMWRDSLHIIPHHLLFGVGPDSVLQFGDEWNVAAYKKFQLRSHFHSTYIQLAVDCGLPCLVAWCWLMSAYLIFVWRCWRRSANWDWFSRGLILGVLGGTVGFVLASFVHYTLGDGEVMVILWLLMGLAIAVARLNGVGDVSSPKYSGTG